MILEEFNCGLCVFKKITFEHFLSCTSFNTIQYFLFSRVENIVFVIVDNCVSAPRNIHEKLTFRRVHEISKVVVARVNVGARQISARQTIK